MAYQVIQDGIVREFLFLAPPAWMDWLRVAEAQGRIGLPLVVMMHGGGVEWQSFGAAWNFSRIWFQKVAGAASLDNQFFLLMPLGFSVADLNGVPLRSWNTGYDGAALATVDDVSFIRDLAIPACEAMLRANRFVSFTPPFPLPKPVFDEDRRFLFGYSAGACMGHRLVAEMPDHWAAIWSMAGSVGGQAHLDAQFPIVKYKPSGSFAVSLFAHHGQADETAPPGAVADTDLQVSALSELYYGTNTTPATADLLAQRFQSLRVTSDVYRNHDNTGHKLTLKSKPDIQGTLLSEQRVFPPGTRDGQNPVVVTYRDPLLTHTGPIGGGSTFADSPNRYFDVEDVWEFFQAHPRVAVPP